MLDQRSEAAVLTAVRAALSQIQAVPIEEPTAGFFSVDETAAAIGVSRETIRRLCASGRMPALNMATADQANYRIPRGFIEYAFSAINSGRAASVTQLANEWQASLAGLAVAS